MSCPKIVAGLFGFLFLLALLAVPVTTTTSSDRVEKGTQIVVRTTYPRRATMFLPRYLSMKSNPGQGRAIRVRSTEWTATMAIVLVLGIFDYAAFCRLMRRRRPRSED